MKSESCIYGGVLATLYHMGRGEKLARHQHPRPHSTLVIAGGTRVTVFDSRPVIEMGAGDPMIELPAEIDHEIEAVMDCTVMLNMIEVPKVMEHDQPAPQSGGVLLDDGTVVFP